MLDSKKFRQKFVSNAAGFSMVEMIVVVGLFGIMAAAMSQMFKNSNNSNSHITQRSDLDIFRRSILARISCQKTLVKLGGAGNCNGGLVDVYDRAGNKMVSSAGTMFGQWTVRAACNNDGLIYMDAGRLKTGAAIGTNANGDFYTDNLTGQVQSFANMRPFFFPPGITPCEDPGVTTAVVASGGVQDIQYGQFTQVGLGGVSLDRANEFSNSTFVANLAGVYNVTYAISYKSGTAWNEGGCCGRIIQVTGGNTIPVATSCSYPTNNTLDQCAMNGSAAISVAAGDQLYLQTVETSGVTGSHDNRQILGASFTITGPL